jgi:predicted ATP-dependent serine protease
MAKDEAPKKKAVASPPKAGNETETSTNAAATPGWQCHNCGVQNPNTKARCACKAWKGGKKKTASNGKSKPSHWGTRSNLSASNIISTGSSARAATKGSHTEKNIYPLVLHKGDLVRLSNE